MKYIYLAGPITGVSYKDTTQWRDTLEFEPGIKGISPMRMKEFLSRKKKIGHSYPEQEIMGAARPIHTRDRYDCTHADAVLAYMPKEQAEIAGYPSLGTCIEMGWASAVGVPVVLVCDDKRVIGHPLVQGLAGWILPRLEDGVAAINGMFAAYYDGGTKVELQEVAGWPSAADRDFGRRLGDDGGRGEARRGVQLA